MIEPNLVSVMMPAYNGEAYVDKAIDSLLAQHYTRWELIVIDDGSTDRTAEIVESYSDKRLRLYHQVNGGEASARNAALRCINGEFIAFLDTDDLFLPNHLEVAVDHFSAHQNTDAIYTDGYYIDAHGNRLDRISSRRRGPFRGNIYPQVLRASDVFGPPLCLVLRREPILEHGTFYDETIGLGTDWDFAIRFSEKAWFEPIEEITCQYRVHDSNLTLMTPSQARKRGRILCRQKAIKMEAFATCALDIRVYAFFDLLVNLLSGEPERQATITQWPEFQDLPAAEKARLYRLIAGRGLRLGIEKMYVDRWFHQAFRLNSLDPRNVLLFLSYSLSPQICRLILQSRSAFHQSHKAQSPFGLLD